MADSSDNSAPRKNGPGRPFQPGQSGNPGGKSPEREALRRYLSEAYGRESIDSIAALARSARSEKVKLDAYVWLAEQSIGKAVQGVSGPDGGPVVDVAALVGALKRAAGEDE